MRRTPIVFLAMLSISGQAIASDESDVIGVVHQWIDAFNKGGIDLALCTEQTSIVDDFPPYGWHGPGACANWLTDYRAFAKTQDIRDAALRLGKQQVYVTDNFAYFSAAATLTLKVAGKSMRQRGATETLVLRKDNAAWRVISEAWAATSPAVAVQTEN